jgi:hypothetical protein
MAMTLRSLAAAAALCCIPCEAANAQQPLSIGTAAGLGDAAVTEARRTDALRWNPALGGVYDGPLSSYTALAVDFQALPAAAWTRPARSLGLDGLPGRAAWLRPRFGGSEAAFAAGSVQWLATQHRDFVLGLSSHHAAAGAVPGSIAQALGGDGGLAGPLPPDSTMRSTASVLALARGAHVGRVPLLGTLWMGATAKGWWVHEYARGSFLGDEPGEEIYRETAIRDVPGYGLDLGLLAQPAERIRVGASVTNLVSGAFRPRKGPRVRVVSILPGEDGEADVTETQGPFLGTEDDGTEDARRARALWESFGYPVVLRLGATVESDVGSFSAAARTPVRDGGLDPELAAGPYTLAYAGPGSLPVHLSYAWGGEGRALSAGVRLGTCERRWTVAMVRRASAWGTTYGASASLTVGSAAGCDVFR